jgi:alpha-tubulin suppressor-like RCC1 family protein
MKKKLFLFFILSVFGFSINLNAQVPDWAWAYDNVPAIGGTTTDASGNLYVSSGLGDAFLVKLDNNGTILWNKSAVGSFDSPPAVQTYSNSIALDASGNIFVTGLFTSDVLTLGTTDFTRVSTVDMFVAKFDSNGDFIWGKTEAIENVGNVGYHIAIDGLGNAIVVGSYSAANLTVGTTDYVNPCTSGGGCPSMLVIKYDSNGNVLWSKSDFAGIGTSYCYSVVTDASNNIYVGGDFLGFRSGIVKYNTDGDILWSQENGGWYLDIDASGNLYSGFDKEAEDVLVKKFNSTDGSNIWTSNATGNTVNKGTHIFSDDDGNVYFTGTYRSNSITFGGQTLTHSGGNDDDIFIVKFQTNGDIDWAKSLNGDSWDATAGFTVDPSGNVFLNGYFLSTSLTFGATTLNVILPQGYNIFFAKLGDNSISTTVPLDPDNLFADAISSSQIDLSWTDNATDEAGYYIESSLDNVSYNVIATLGANSTSYSNTGLTASTTYFYRVQAFNGAGSSAYSNIESATTFDVTATVPADPTSLDVNTYSASEISMSWADNADNEDGYDIERSMDGINFSYLASVGMNVSNYFDAGLTPNTMYYYRVYGYNVNGNSGFTNVGFATTNDSTTTLLPIDIQKMAGGMHGSYFVCDNSGALAIGYNIDGELGNETNTNSSLPVSVSFLSDVVSVSAGWMHTMYIKSDGTVWATGSNAYGQLGDGTTTSRNTATQISSLSGIVSASGGFGHSVFLKNDGTVWTCGKNDMGQLGDGTANQSTTPMQIPNLSGITAISAGDDFTLFLKNDGTVLVCGYNMFGQFGNGTTSGFTPNPVPVPVLNVSDIIAVKALGNSSIFLKNDGTVWATGWNGQGQLGDGTTVDKSLTIQVLNLSGITALGGGQQFALFLKDDGTSWACGNNDNGQFGNGTLTNSNPLPVQAATSVSAITAIAAGSNHSLFLKDDGTVWACGSNYAGQLGNGSTTNSVDPIQISTLCTIGGSTTTIPANPSNLNATATSETTATLEWMDNSTDESSFVIYRSLDWTNYVEIATVSANSTSYMDDGLDCNTFYAYKVLAHNSAGYSTNGAYDTITTFACGTATVPNPATNLFADAISASQIYLTWNDNSSDETGFRIKRSLDNVTFSNITTVSANSTSYTDYGLTPNTMYYYKVQAYNDEGNATNSNVSSATTMDSITQTIPASPTNLIASATSSTQASLTWNDNSDNENGFVIRRSLDGVSYVDAGSVGANVEVFNDNGLTANTFYYYQVCAYNDFGYSTSCGWDTTTTFDVTVPVPSSPTNLIATATSTSSIQLNWNDNANNETGFLIKRSLDNVTYVNLTTLSSNATSFVDNGLTENTTYYYKVRAFNASGNSAFSNVDNATTFDNGQNQVPDAPTNLVATTMTSHKIKLTWTDNSDNEDGFYVKRSLDGVTFVRIDTLLANVEVYNDLGLDPNTTYYYQIRAFNENGGAPLSNIDSATTFESQAGIFDVSNIQFNVYPNPTKDYFTIGLENFENTNAEITSIKGEIIQTFTLNSNKTIVKTDKFNAGIYILKLENENGTTFKRIVKE